MNPDKKPDYKRIYSIVKSRYDKTEFFSHGHLDETFFTLRVFETAKEIIEKLGQKCIAEQVLVASLLHDIGKTKLNTDSLKQNIRISDEEWDRHPGLGVSISRKILNDIGHSKGFIDRICYLVKNHERRNVGFKKSIELQVLQDADLIADYGFSGFIRPFLYGHGNHDSIIGSIRFLKEKENRIEKEGLLNLDISKEIAHENISISY